MKTKLSIITLALLPCLAAAKVPDVGVMQQQDAATSDSLIVKYKKKCNSNLSGRYCFNTEPKEQRPGNSQAKGPQM